MIHQNKPRAAQAEIGDKLRHLIAARYAQQPERKKQSRRDQIREAQRYVPGKRGMGRRGI